VSAGARLAGVGFRPQRLAARAKPLVGTALLAGVYAATLLLAGSHGWVVWPGAVLLLGLFLFLALPLDDASPQLPGSSWFPLHLVLVGTGGGASPLLPAIAVWLLWLSGRRGPVLGWATAAAVLLLVVDVWRAQVGTGSVAAAAVLLVGGVLAGGLGSRRAGSATVSAEPGPWGRPDARGEASSGRTVLPVALERVRERTGSSRAVLWAMDVREARAQPTFAVGGERPRTLPQPGDPLFWAWEQRLPLRLEPPPSWATGAVTAIPLEVGDTEGTLLSLESETGGPPLTEEAQEDARLYVREFLMLERRLAEAAASRARALHLVEVLQRLPRQIEPQAFARELATAAVELVGGSGAAVATWDEDAGHVLAVVGEDGGPEAGSVFGPMESDLALAARSGAVVLREARKRRGSAPLVAAGEAWGIAPTAALALPLTEPDASVHAAISVWSSETEALDPEGVRALQAIAPYAALQLRHARAFGDLQRLAEHDELTGLHNRRAFQERLGAEGARYARYDRPLSLLILDIDHFKAVNDTYGHEAGDAVLRAVGGAIAGAIRETDFAARFGGEEFVVLLPETRLPDAADAAERLRHRIEHLSVAWQGESIPVRVSVGVSGCPACVEGPETLVQSADRALYDAKAKGRNRVATARPGG
jgi:diguanylate cyclase (GGDEF)-like protein